MHLSPPAEAKYVLGFSEAQPAHSWERPTVGSSSQPKLLSHGDNVSTVFCLEFRELVLVRFLRQSPLFPE